MARADLLLSLVRAGVSGNRLLFRKAVEAVVAEERAKHHTVLADHLMGCLDGNHFQERQGAPTVTNARVHDLFYEVTPRRELPSLVLPENVLAACRELIEEQQRIELLRSHSLEPRHRVLLAGPPGNGKTSLAEGLAQALMVPFLVVRYDGIIGSFLGETASRLSKLFDYVRTLHCVLFLDEFDTLGKERGDPHDTGEIKRVVSSLLLQIDDLPSHVVVVTATNHPELLDRAVWRRFQLRLRLPMPTKKQRQEWFERLAERNQVTLGFSPRTLAEKLGSVSFAELEDFSQDIARRCVLSAPDADVRGVVRERLSQWRARFRLSE